MDYMITLLDLPDQPTLTMRETHAVEKLPAFFTKAFGGVMAYLQELGEAPAGMPFGAYYNLDMSALDVEAGFPVAKGLQSKGEVKASVIPGGKFISTVFKGPYDKMKPVYDALTKWAQVNGYQPSGIAYEYYLNDPSESPDIVAETEVRLPVTKIS
jgi:effector-binding domain-containing protein